LEDSLIDTKNCCQKERREEGGLKLVHYVCAVLYALWNSKRHKGKCEKPNALLYYELYTCLKADFVTAFLKILETVAII